MVYRDFFRLIEVHLGISIAAGHDLGIYDSQDMLSGEADVERRHAARIFHNIIHENSISDLESIDGAAVLLDLYDCRVCVNHIAQVYLRGIMGERLERIFDGRAAITEEETRAAIEQILKLIEMNK